MNFQLFKKNSKNSVRWENAFIHLVNYVIYKDPVGKDLFYGNKARVIYQIWMSLENSHFMYSSKIHRIENRKLFVVTIVAFL